MRKYQSIVLHLLLLASLVTSFQATALAQATPLAQRWSETRIYTKLVEPLRPKKDETDEDRPHSASLNTNAQNRDHSERGEVSEWRNVAGEEVKPQKGSQMQIESGVRRRHRLPGIMRPELTLQEGMQGQALGALLDDMVKQGQFPQKAITYAMTDPAIVSGAGLSMNVAAPLITNMQLSSLVFMNQLDNVDQWTRGESLDMFYGCINRKIGSSGQMGYWKAFYECTASDVSHSKARAFNANGGTTGGGANGNMKLDDSVDKNDQDADPRQLGISTDPSETSLLNRYAAQLYKNITGTDAKSFLKEFVDEFKGFIGDWTINFKEVEDAQDGYPDWTIELSEERPTGNHFKMNKAELKEAYNGILAGLRAVCLEREKAQNPHTSGPEWEHGDDDNPWDKGLKESHLKRFVARDLAPSNAFLQSVYNGINYDNTDPLFIFISGCTVANINAALTELKLGTESGKRYDALRWVYVYSHFIAEIKAYDFFIAMEAYLKSAAVPVEGVGNASNYLLYLLYKRAKTSDLTGYREELKRELASFMEKPLDYSAEEVGRRTRGFLSTMSSSPGGENPV